MPVVTYFDQIFILNSPIVLSIGQIGSTYSGTQRDCPLYYKYNLTSCADTALVRSGDLDKEYDVLQWWRGGGMGWGLWLVGWVGTVIVTQV